VIVRHRMQTMIKVKVTIGTHNRRKVVRVNQWRKRAASKTNKRARTKTVSKNSKTTTNRPLKFRLQKSPPIPTSQNRQTRLTLKINKLVAKEILKASPTLISSAATCTVSSNHNVAKSSSVRMLSSALRIRSQTRSLMPGLEC